MPCSAWRGARKVIAAAAWQEADFTKSHERQLAGAVAMQQSWSGGWISDKHRPAVPPGAPPHPLPVACRVALVVPALGSECMGDLLGRLSAADARRGAGDNRPLTAIERDGESIW